MLGKALTLSVVLFFGFYFHIYEAPGVPCACGYGGVCRFKDGKPIKWNCSQCEIVSGGLYENCNDLANHCKSNPCLNGGRCVKTFGSFFCECAPEFMGHTCRYRRTEEDENFETLVGPRAWFQVNSFRPQITNKIFFTFENPGDNVLLQVRFDDGRLMEVLPTRFKYTNARRDCISDVRRSPKERDIRVCETLPDKKLYSVRIDTRYFDGHDDEVLPMEKVNMTFDGKNITVGRVNEIHISVVNKIIVSFSQVYRIFTSFAHNPKCRYRIYFIGCTRRKNLNIIHDKGHPIHLRAIREPIDSCPVGQIVETSWHIPGKYPIKSNVGNFSLAVNGKDVKPGINYIDFRLTIRGSPDYHGGRELTYNLARCWYKVVMGAFKVGLMGGKSRMVPCISPLTLRMFGLNPNFREVDLASVWRCEPSELENCEKRRYLGSKIFLRTLPCETNIYLTSMVVYPPTGNKFFMDTMIHTTIHIDSLRCRCEYNCYPRLDPRSSTRMMAENVRLSTTEENEIIEWKATLSGEDFDINEFISSETMGSLIEIDPGTFLDYRVDEQDPYLRISAHKRDLFCSLDIEIDLHPAPVNFKKKEEVYLDNVEDKRFHLELVGIALSKLVEPVTYEAREIITENQHETIQTIRAEFRHFYLKLTRPTYIVALNLLGMESKDYQIQDTVIKPRNKSKRQLTKWIQVIQKLFIQGNYNIVVSEIMYFSRVVMSKKKHYLQEKLIILAILDKVTSFTFIAATPAVLSELTRVLQIINRLMVLTELTKPPFNIDISPWIAPRLFLYPEEAMNWSVNMRICGNIILKTATHFYQVSSADGTTRFSQVLGQLFHALLRFSLIMLRHKHQRSLMESYSRGRLQYDRDFTTMQQTFDESVYFLQKSIDHHTDGYMGEIQIESGTATIYSTVFPAYSVSKVAENLFNLHQLVRVRITISDETMNSRTRLYFSIYVEVPSKNEITTRVHITLLTHLTQMDVNTTTEVQMQVHKPGQTYSNTDTTIAYVTTPSATRDRQKSITTYKYEITPESLNTVDHQIYIHFRTNDEVVFELGPEVPTYNNLQASHGRGKGEFNVSLITQEKNLYLSLIPGQNVPTDSPRSVAIHMDSAVCAIREPLEVWTVDQLEKNKVKECTIAKTKKFVKGISITCVCRGDGIIATYQSVAALFHVLYEQNAEEMRVEEEVERVSLWALPLILLVLFFIAWWRDRKNKEMEFIQILEDNFPGDSVPYIVGVYTGKRLFASTRTEVALRIHGTLGMSRVHILKSKSYKTLGRGQDDWFLVFTKRSLGKLEKISLWQDFDHACPGLATDWYCSRIVIYDVLLTTWTKFPVKGWIGLTGGMENARITTSHGVRFHPEIERLMSFTFCKHYFRVLSNVHPLLSLFFKTRRHIHSHRLRVLSFTMLILPLLCFTLYVDDVIGQRYIVFQDRLLVVSNVSIFCTVLLFTVVAFLIGKSFEKTRRTKKLDLRRVGELKSITREYMRQKSQAGLSEEELERVATEEYMTEYKFTLTSPSRIISPEKPRHSTKRNLFRRSTRFDANSLEVYKASANLGKGKSGSAAWSHQGRFTNLFKWVPEATFRPIRFKNDLNYIRYGGWGYLISGWILGTLVTVLASSYIFYRAITEDELHRKHSLVIIMVANCFIWFVHAPIFYLLSSLLVVYHAKLGNFEAHFLELAGLPENKRAIDHKKFIEQVTRSEYHPPKTEMIERLFKQHLDIKKVLTYIYFFWIIIFALLPSMLILAQDDASSIWKLKNFVAHSLKESVSNYYFPRSKVRLLQTAHDKKGIRRYLLSVFLPATTKSNWYNGKPMQMTPGYGWFIDQASKLYPLTIVRVISASNRSRVYVPTYFAEYFEEAYYLFDMNDNYTTYLNDWSRLQESRVSYPYLDWIVKHGVYGKSGIFYPQCIGKEIYLREDKARNAAGIFHIVHNYVHKRTRALIIELGIVHSCFSTYSLNPMHAMTRVQILFEEAASGPYTGSVHTSVEYAQGSTNKLRYLSIALYSYVALIFIIYVILMASYEGISVCIREFREITVTIIAIISFLTFALLLGDTIYGFLVAQEDVGKTIDVLNHIDLDHHIFRFVHTAVVEFLIGCQPVMLCILLADFTSQFFGFVERSYVRRILVPFFVAYSLLQFLSLVSQQSAKIYGRKHNRLIVILIDASPFTCPTCTIQHAFHYAFCLLWHLFIGLIIGCHLRGLELYLMDPATRGFPLFSICKYLRKQKKTVNEFPANNDFANQEKGNEVQPTATEKKEEPTDVRVTKQMSPVFKLFE